MPELTRLIIRIAPLPWESLEGYLNRARQANLYDERTSLYELLGVNPYPGINMLRLRRDYHNLATLTALDEATLKAMTLHRFVDRFYLQSDFQTIDNDEREIDGPLWQERWFATYVVGQGKRAKRKLCPLCWRQYGTLFLPWALSHVTTCPEHAVLLVDRCKCGASLYYKTFAPQCRVCKMPIDQFPVIPLGTHAPSLGLQALVSSAIGIVEGYPESSLNTSSNHPLQQMCPASLFRFLTTIANLLAARYPDDPLFDPDQMLVGAAWNTPPKANVLFWSDVTVVHGALTGVWRLLDRWPEHWHALLTRIAAREEYGDRPKRYSFPSVLFAKGKLGGPTFGWLHQNWGEFFYNTVGRHTGVIRWYRVYKKLQRRLGDEEPGFPILLPLEKTNELIGSGDILKICMEQEVQAVRKGWDPVSGRPTHLVEREVAKRVREEHATLVTLSQAADEAGIGRVPLRSLIDAGWIQPVYFDRVDQRRHVRISLEELYTCILLLTCKLAVGDPPDNARVYLSVGEALASARVPLADLLIAIDGGQLAAYLTGNDLTLRHLRIAKDGDDGLKAYCMRRLQASHQFDYMFREAISMLGCCPQALIAWCYGGLIFPYRIVTDNNGEHWHFDVVTLGVFKARYMGTAECAARLGRTPETVCRWAQVGRLTPAIVWGDAIDPWYLFDRAALESLVSSWVSAAEAATLLGISNQSFSRWLKQGLIHPIDQEMQSLRLYDRNEVLRVRERLVMNPRTVRSAGAQLLPTVRTNDRIDTGAGEVIAAPEGSS